MNGYINSKFEGIEIKKSKEKVEIVHSIVMVSKGYPAKIEANGPNRPNIANRLVIANKPNEEFNLADIMRPLREPDIIHRS